MSKATPGPWEATDDGDIQAFVPEAGCRMSLIGDGEISNLADAKLMASAPEMLEILRRIAGLRYAENMDGSADELIARLGYEPIPEERKKFPP